MRILIVDDNKDNLYMLSSLLTGYQYEVIEATNGEEALIKLKNNNIELIISDILMPVMDGFTLCREIRKSSEYASMPFIFFTATYTGPQDEALALKIGADKFLIKPCETEIIIKTIRETLDRCISRTRNTFVSNEEEVLKLYNDRLVRKLEQKMLQAEEEVKAKERALEALHRSELLLNATQSISKIGGWEWDIALQEMYWTLETYKIHDLEPADDVLKGTETISISITCYAPEERHIIADAFIDCLEKGIPYELEFKFTSYKGKKKYVRTAGQPVFDNGKIIKVIGNIQDITDRRKNELERVELLEQLRQTQRLDSIGQLAGGVAHDFNNVLAVILGYSEDIISSLQAEDPIYKDMEEIIKAGKKAQNLTRQLLTFSRKHVVQPQIININNTIKDMSQMIARILGEDIKLDMNLSESLYNIKADVAQIEQVMMNLVINARDAMPTGGKLILTTSNINISSDSKECELGLEPSDYIKFTVMDNGSGMDNETAQRVFEPFFTTKQSKNGTGLGLSTVYGIINQSDGLILLDSAPGKGACFTIYLPKTDDELIPILEEQDALELYGYGEHIVVVEDDSAMGILTKKMLKKLGYRVTLFDTPEEVIHNIVDGGLKPDLIITDVVMPEINGKELTDMLHKKYPDLKVIYMSGYTDSVILDHGVFDKDTSYIQKPFSKEEIAHKVKQMLISKSNPKQKIAHILMIDDDESIIMLYNRAFLKRGHFFTGKSSVSEALDAIAKYEFQAILVDMNIPGTDGIKIIKEIKQMDCHALIIPLSGDIHCINPDNLKDVGLQIFFEKSNNILPLIETIEKELR